MVRDGEKNVPVSVIIPCYKCSPTIASAVESVVRQTRLPVELFLIDDASPDNGQTIAALNSLRDRFGRIIKINIINFDKNRGPAFARNTGWDAASQPYVAFLDADDAWHPRKLEISYDIIKENPFIDLLGHDFYINGCMGEIDAFLSGVNYGIVKKSFYPILLLNPFVTPSIFLKKSISERFNVNLRYCEDHEFLLRVSRIYNVYYAKLKLVQLGKEPFTGGGLTAKRTRMRLGEISMYFEALKYKKSLVLILPLLILFSLVKHSVLLGLTQFRMKVFSL
ncbi:MAG: glycosyltransferase family 2 protein [Syntrophales bacterium]|jgi:glycosyltransferase involved in cell wall biosynthesis